MSLTSPNNFTGIYKIGKTTYTLPDLQAFIDEYEQSYLVRLFGVELFSLFMADLDVNNVPQTPRFVKIYNKFFEQVENSQVIFYPVYASWNRNWEPCIPGNRIIESYGIIDMLTGFIYFDYNRQNDTQAMPSGNRTPEQDASKETGQAIRTSKLTTPYNRAIQSYQAIQEYMSVIKKEDYPEYKGVAMEGIYLGGAL